MPDPMKPYVIKQGDYLTRLSHRLGFVADEVWNHGKNAELKSLRKDPETLKQLWKTYGCDLDREYGSE